MVKGQRRHTPPPGYMSSTEAIEKLGKMLYKHVEEGRIKKIMPPGRKVGYYKRDDVEKVLSEELLFSSPYLPGRWKRNPTSTYALTTEDDMPAIVEISRLIFGDGAAPVEIRLTWLRKNPETFFTLRNASGAIVGYASLLPLRRAVLDRFIRDEIDMSDITADDIEPFEAGKPLHLYIMAIGIDPRLSTREKHEYGAVLERGLFAFFFGLATRGVEIETVTARSHKPDGLRLLRKLGIPQLHSPVPGKSLFAVRVPDSGFPLFERYSELLREWQEAHQGRARTPVERKPDTQHIQRARPRRTVSAPPTHGTAQPPDTLTIEALATRVHRSKSTLITHFTEKYDKPLEAGEPPEQELEHIRIPVPARPGWYSRYFTDEQAARIATWIEGHTRKTQPSLFDD